MAVHVGDGELTGAESSSIKVFGTERILEVTRLLLGVVGAAGYLVPAHLGQCCGAAWKPRAARRRSTRSAGA